MPRTKTTYPEPTREKGQRNLDLPLYLDRIIPAFSQPEWLEARRWRTFVANQPFATIFRDTLLSNVLSLDWKIEPKDNEKRDEYKEDINYYTDFFNDTGEYDYAELIEWIGKDVLDLPFGGAAEVGREGDSPDGKVLWLDPLDGGTLFPTMNKNYPVGQAVMEMSMRQVYFPAHAINRIYLSPRTDIRRKGWGMPPPEKIFLAIEMLRRGDIYYANLLLDTPEAGILDLIDMSKESATNWVEAWKSMLAGIDPFKIPVLYEHEQSAKWIPFTKPPADIMFDKATMKYVGLVAAGYGMSASDVGFSPVSSGGETLAGSIRQERKTRKTGLTLMKRKFTTFFNRLLPDYLEWKFIDLDDEVSTNVGRARLASMTAIGSAIDKRVLTPNEGRQQLVSDGLITISIPEEYPEEEMPEPMQTPFGGNQPGESPERPSLLGRPISPSQGGYGEIKSFIDDDIIGDLSDYIRIPLFQEDSEIVEGEVNMSNQNGEMSLLQALMMIGKALIDFQKRPINVYIPKSEIPVNVNVPTPPVPIINVSVPEQKPVVNVSVPEQNVVVKAHRRSVGRQKVKRDQEGNLLETITETEYQYDGE